jgi:hypothetical protein
MGVAVGQLLLSCFPDRQDLDIEGQVAASKRMIGIDFRLGQTHLADRNLARTLFGLDDGDHARLPFFSALQMLDLNLLDCILQTRAIGLLGSQLDSEPVARNMAFQRLDQPIHQPRLAIQVEHRFVHP